MSNYPGEKSSRRFPGDLPATILSRQFLGAMDPPYRVVVVYALSLAGIMNEDWERIIVAL